MCLNIWARDTFSRVNPKEDIALAQQTWGQDCSVYEAGMGRVAAQNDSEKKPGPWIAVPLGNP